MLQNSCTGIYTLHHFKYVETQPQEIINRVVCSVYIELILLQTGGPLSLSGWTFSMQKSIEIDLH